MMTVVVDGKKMKAEPNVLLNFLILPELPIRCTRGQSLVMQFQYVWLESDTVPEEKGTLFFLRSLKQANTAGTTVSIIAAAL